MNNSKPCPSVSELLERVAYLEGELGLLNDAQDRAELMRVWKLSPQEAELVAILHALKGRPMDAVRLDERMRRWRIGEERDLDSLRVVVYAIRRKLGRSAVETFQPYGWALSAEGWERVQAVMDAGRKRLESRTGQASPYPIK